MTPLQTINQQYQDIRLKNIQAICNAYAKSEETYVFVEGPRLSTIGYKAIEKGWIDFVASPILMQEIQWVEGPFEHTEGSVGLVCGMILVTVLVNEHSFQNKFRATFMMKLQEDGWKIFHEHVSLPHPDPYGIGDWLKK